VSFEKYVKARNKFFSFLNDTVSSRRLNFRKDGNEGYEVNPVFIKSDSIKAYFKYLHERESHKASTLNSVFSMLRASLLDYTRNSINIIDLNDSKFDTLRDFISKLNKAHIPNQAPSYNSELLNPWIMGWDDPHRKGLRELELSAFAVLAINGAMRNQGMRGLDLDDVQLKTSAKGVEEFDVHARGQRKNRPQGKIFKICNPKHVACLKEFVRRRKEAKVSLRTLFCRTTQDGFMNQVRGKNWYQNACKIVAQKIGEPNPQDFSCHSFRHSSATFMHENGASEVQIQNLGGWKNSSMVRHYIHDSDVGRRRQSNLIAPSDQPESTDLVVRGTTTPRRSSSSTTPAPRLEGQPPPQMEDLGEERPRKMPRLEPSRAPGGPPFPLSSLGHSLPGSGWNFSGNTGSINIGNINLQFLNDPPNSARKNPSSPSNQQ